MENLDTTSSETRTITGGSIVTKNPVDDMEEETTITECGKIVSIVTENLPNELEMVNTVKLVMENINISSSENRAEVETTDNLHSDLVDNIVQRFENLGPLLSDECCIYRIPKIIRTLNEEAYTPVMVSIGPYHRDMGKFQFMEEYKWRYLRKFVERSGASLQRYVKLVKDNEGRARKSYAETIEMSSDEFVTMILLDGCFILELLLQSSSYVWPEFGKYILSKGWLLICIHHDLILLENQLPFFILEILFNLAFPYKQHEPFFLYEIILNFFCSYNNQNKPPIFRHVKHFTDLVRYLYLPMSNRWEQENRNPCTKFVHSATQLHEAGVKFKAGSSECLLDVTFTNGMLEFPCLKLMDETESLFRNLMALEFCHYPSNRTPIIDYVIFLDTLIDTTKDVDLLVKNGMLHNCLGSSSAAVEVVSKICTKVPHSCQDSYLLPLFENLNNYCNLSRNRWRTTLTRDYFSTPWRTASTIAAIMLLLLTLAQTICSVLSVIKGN